MVQELALTIPGADGKSQVITAPSSVPTGGLSKVSETIGVAVTILIIVAAIYCLFVLVQAGMQMTTSSGDKQKIASARARLTYAIIGLIVALSSFFFVNLLGGFFGIKLLGAN